MHSSSTTLSASLPSSSATAAWRLIAPLAAVHAAMFAYDVAHPERFLHADRALVRMSAIENWRQVAAHGIPGDWLP